MEYYITQPEDYWIAPNAVTITLNALGDANRIQCSVASGAVVMCFVESIKGESEGGEAGNGDGLWYGRNHEPRRWPISGNPTYFNSNTQKLVYVAIPRSTTIGTQAVIVFPSEELDIYGRARRLTATESDGSTAGEEGGDEPTETYEQIGSTDYFYIFLHGIISSTNGITARIWEDPMEPRDWGILETSQGREEKNNQSDWYSYSQVGQLVTFLREIAMTGDANFRNLILNHKSLTDVATSAATDPVNSDTMVATPNYISKFYLSKVADDVAAGYITFIKGLLLGKNGHGIDANGAAILDAITSKNFQSGEVGGAGFGMYLSPNGVSTAEVDNLIVRMKAVFAELEIKKKSFSAGDLGFSDAANKLLLVLPVDGNGGVLATNEGAVAYRCCWLMKDGDDAVTNDWHVDDQARCQTFNIKPGVYSNVSNRYYWRKVLEAGESFEYEGNEYNYIDLAAAVTGTYKGVDFTKGCQTGVNNDIPKAQDHVIQLGNQSDIARQNYTEIIVNGSDAPAIKQYQGINDYTLSGKLIRGDYYDPVKNIYRSVVYGDFYAGDKERSGGYAEYDKSTNTFVVKGKLEVGSTLEDGREVNDLGVRKGNLLRNSGFTGDYESESVTSSTSVSDDTIIYSDPFDCWEQNGCRAVEDTSSASGMAAVIGTLTQTIDGGMTVGEWYIFSFRGQSGSVTMNVGGVSHVFELSSDLERYDYPFVCQSNEPFSLVGNGAKVMELQLMAGNMPSEWHSAHKDNDRALASYYANEYLRNAILEASTTINGGLILSQIIKVGNYRNKVMTEETGGMSGAYNDDRSPFLWGGGTMEQAIYTIMRYANNPTYQATDAEVLNNMAKFVVTHGGRAILNDIILRGYIYALGGVFNGTVYADKGIFGGLITTNFKDVALADGIYISGTPKTYTMGKEDLSIMFNAPIATRQSPEIALEVILPTSEYYIGKEVNILSVGAIYDEGFLNSVRVKTVNAGTTQRNTYIYGIDQYQRTIGSHTITYYATNYIDFDSGVLCVVGAPYEYTTVVEGQVVTHRETMWMLKSISCRIKRNGDNGLAISDLPSSE